MSARVIAVIGPSGAGKDTLMAAAAGGDVSLVRRTITRPAEAGGEVFDAVTPHEFDRLRKAGMFAVYWHANGLSYAIPPGPFPGRAALANISRAALTQAARAFPGLAVIHVTADPAVLARRLSARGRERPDDIAARLARAPQPNFTGLPLREIDNSGALADAVTAFRIAVQELSA